jgi:hypothetical protein
MDGFRFDRLTRTLTAAGSRRRALSSLLAGTLGILGWHAGEAAAHDFTAKCKKKSGEAKKKCLKRAKKHAAAHRRETPPPPPPTGACTPACSSDEDCLGGTCYLRCEPPCGPGQGCVRGLCARLDMGCTATDRDGCTSPFPEISPCPWNATSDGMCAMTADGAYCVNTIHFRDDGQDLCQTDADCVDLGWGPNARCQACPAEAPGRTSCLTSNLDALDCMPAGGPCRAMADCCQMFHAMPQPVSCHSGTCIPAECVDRIGDGCSPVRSSCCGEGVVSCQLTLGDTGQCLPAPS